MLMVVFGAGASFDSAASYPGDNPSYPSGPNPSEIQTNRPPLADELFDDRPRFAAALAKFPECQPIIPKLRHRKDDAPVERVLEQLQTAAESYPEGERQLAAIRYYLHSMLWDCEEQWEKIHNGVTNYKTLLDEIHRQLGSLRKVCLVTFNYDRMLEAALPTVGIRIHSISDYVNSSEYKIIKLHGSVNWGRKISERPIKELHQLRHDQVPAKVIQVAPELLAGQFVSRDFVKVDHCPMGKWNEVAVFPAIAIPLERKLYFECPDNHLLALKQCIPETTKLLIIGWRATDAPFLELLRSQLPSRIKALVVAGSRQEADNIVERLQETGIRGTYLRGRHGFTSSISSGEVEGFLRS